MKHSVRQRAGIAAVAALVITTGIGITSLTASGEGSTPITQDRGTLTLEFSIPRSGTVTYQAPGDVDPVVQTLSVLEPCSTVVLGGAQLLTFTPTAPSNPSVQLPSNGLGVESGSNCGVPAGFVSRNQTLTVGLGSDIKAIDSTIRIESATLEIERRSSASLKWTTTNYPTGTKTTATVSSTTDTFSATIGATGNFTHVQIEPEGGHPQQRGVSLKGATFDLISDPEFEDDVPCEGEVGTGVVIGGAATSADFYRGLNDGAESSADCDDIGVTLQILEGSVLLNKGTTGLTTSDEQNVNATLTINWAPVVHPDGPNHPDVSEVLSREINLTPDDPDTYEDVLWCLSAQYDEEGDLIVESVEHPIGVPWCLVSNEETLVGGAILQVQVYHGSGDPSWK